MKSIDDAKSLIQTEINELEASISSRKSEINTAYNDAIKLAERSKKEAEKEISSVLKNIETLKNVLSNMSGKIETAKPIKAAKPITPLFIPKMYTEAKTVKEKIAFVVDFLKGGFKEDIAKQIAHWDKTEADAVVKQISGQLSALKSKGQLNSTKDGRRDKYTIVK